MLYMVNMTKMQVSKVIKLIGYHFTTNKKWRTS